MAGRAAWAADSCGGDGDAGASGDACGGDGGGDGGERRRLLPDHGDCRAARYRSGRRADPDRAAPLPRRLHDENAQTPGAGRRILRNRAPHHRRDPPRTFGLGLDRRPHRTRPSRPSQRATRTARSGSMPPWCAVSPRAGRNRPAAWPPAQTPPKEHDDDTSSNPVARHCIDSVGRSHGKPSRNERRFGASRSRISQLQLPRRRLLHRPARGPRLDPGAAELAACRRPQYRLGPLSRRGRHASRLRPSRRRLCARNGALAGGAVPRVPRALQFHRARRGAGSRAAARPHPGLLRSRHRRAAQPRRWEPRPVPGRWLRAAGFRKAGRGR